MKKLLLFIMSLSLCLLPACKGEAPEFSDPWGSALVIQVDKGGIVVVDDQNGTAVMPMPRWISFESEELGTELLPGMTVELAGGSGSILLTSPAHIDPEHIMAVDYDGGLIGLYWDVLAELEGRGPELDKDTSSVCIDLHNAANLPFGAAGAITWCANDLFGREVLGGTFSSLNDSGRLSGEELRWEDGVFLEVKTEDMAEDSFTLICTKQRSREEKLSMTVKAERDGGLWTWREAQQ